MAESFGFPRASAPPQTRQTGTGDQRPETATVSGEDGRSNETAPEDAPPRRRQHGNLQADVDTSLGNADGKPPGFALGYLVMAAAIYPPMTKLA